MSARRHPRLVELPVARHRDQHGPAPATSAPTEWARWLAQFRPEARQLFELMIEVRVRLAREAYARQPDAQPTPQTTRGGQG